MLSGEFVCISLSLQRTPLPVVGGYTKPPSFGLADGKSSLKKMQKITNHQKSKRKNEPLRLQSFGFNLPDSPPLRRLRCEERRLWGILRLDGNGPLVSLFVRGFFRFCFAFFLSEFFLGFECVFWFIIRLYTLGGLEKIRAV